MRRRMSLHLVISFQVKVNEASQIKCFAIISFQMKVKEASQIKRFAICVIFKLSQNSIVQQSFCFQSWYKQNFEGNVSKFCLKYLVN